MCGLLKIIVEHGPPADDVERYSFVWGTNAVVRQRSSIARPSH